MAVKLVYTFEITLTEPVYVNFSNSQFTYRVQCKVAAYDKQTAIAIMSAIAYNNAAFVLVEDDCAEF